MTPAAGTAGIVATVRPYVSTAPAVQERAYVGGSQIEPAVVGIVAPDVKEYTAPPRVAENENVIVEGTTALTEVVVVTT